MGGSSSKKRSKSKKASSTQNYGIQISRQQFSGFDDVSDHYGMDSTDNQLNDLERSVDAMHNTYTRSPSLDADNWLSEMDRTDRMANNRSQATSFLDDWQEPVMQYPKPPPPYSEVDPLAFGNGHPDTRAAMRGYASIPNLMDVGIDDLSDALQTSDRHRGAAIRNQSPIRKLPSKVLSEYQKDWKNENVHDKSSSASRDDLTSSNPNLATGFGNKVKPKTNGMSDFQKPANITKKKNFQSNPDIFASSSKLMTVAKAPVKRNNRFPQGKQNSSWNSNGNTFQQKGKVITSEHLAVLAKKSNQEMLFRIQNFSTGFVSLLHETDYPDDVLVLVMDILAKVCRNDDCPHTANALLQTALYTKLFNVRMVNYLQSAPYDGSMDENPTLLQNLLVVFTTVLREFSKEAENKLGRCLTLGRQAISQLIGPSGDLDDELIKELRKLTDVQKFNSFKNPVQSSGYPTVFNINHEPSSCEELSKSSDYKHHLLQMLQKEFADSVQTAPEDSGAPHPDVYYNVSIIGTDCTYDEGLVHKLSFKTDGLEIAWNDTTKLLEGSTVFLSPNLQKELHCAVVIRRRQEELEQGHVWVKLLDRKSTILQCTKPMDMLENFTYWDDFVSLMDALHLQLPYPVPFASHILGVKKKMSHPQYLDGKSCISFPTLQSTAKDSKKQINALNINTWPSSAAFGVDRSFYESFKHAMTKELALIYSTSGAEALKFGVFVLQTLLHNEGLWRHSSQAPIMVLFRTDEALDDFLKAHLALSPMGKVVRMGAGRQDALLSIYNLNEARDIVYNTEDFPPYVMQNRRVLRDKMGRLKADIVHKMELLEKSRLQILKGEALKSCISEHHWSQLESQNFNFNADILLQWLSSYTLPEFQSLQNEKRCKTSNKNKVPKRIDKKCSSPLVQIEMKRRVLSFPSAGFDDWETVFNQKSASLNSEDSFISQDQTEKHPMSKHKGPNFCLSEIIRLELEKKDDVNPSEVDDLFFLEPRDRWRLYRHWLSEFERRVGKELCKLQEKYDKCFLQLQEVIREIDVSILQRVKVVLITTSSAAKNHRLLKMVAPRIVMVEEAGQISEASLISSLTEQCCHLICIGDHHQLRPAMNGFRSSDKASRPKTISLFEILISKGIKYFSLPDNYQMSQSLQTVFKSLFVDLPFASNDVSSSSPAVRGMASDIFFINNSLPESVDCSSPYLYTNKYEAEYLVMLARYLTRQGYAQTQMSILATGISQVQLLVELSKKANLGQITCSTVEGYQGRSNDIVLLSLVRSNQNGDVGVMADDNYMSVALTRARLGLYCIGNFKMFVDSLEGWKNNITFLVGQQLYGSTLKLKCYWHPTQTTEIASWKDLEASVNGFCKHPCNVSMSCGHKCTKKCHAKERDHQNGQCRRPCLKTVCPAGHKCQKMCFEKCPPCQMSFIKKWPNCGHEEVIRCPESMIKTICTKKCNQILACGHICPKHCGEECDDLACTAIIEFRDSPCKHMFFVPCSQVQMSGLEKLCPMPCTETLPCGHACTGTCGQCQQGRIHIACKAKCEAFLICGHQCQELCGNNCVPCKGACSSRCDHNKCPSGCGRPCVPCLKPCSWKCSHQKCSKMCFELCDRTACNHPCPRLLPCKHPCIGFCGEPCPRLCRICNRDRILEGMSSDQKIGTVRFVLLEDCNHVVEVSRLNCIMQGLGTVEVKTCPMCGTAIKKCRRYGNAIKTTLFDVCKIVHQCKEGDSELTMSIRELRNAIRDLPENILPEAVQQLKTEVQQNLNCLEVVVLENKYKFLKCMFSLWQTNMLVSSQDSLKGHRMLLNLKTAYLGLSSTSGPVVLDDFASELKRAIYLIHLFQFATQHSAKSSSFKIAYSTVCNSLSNTKTFSAPAEAMVLRKIRQLYLICNIPHVRVEGIDSTSISDVQQLTAGHWTKCENGHFCFSKQYVIGQEVQCQFCTRGNAQ